MSNDEDNIFGSTADLVRVANVIEEAICRNGGSKEDIVEIEKDPVLADFIGKMIVYAKRREDSGKIQDDYTHYVIDH